MHLKIARIAVWTLAGAILATHLTGCKAEPEVGVVKGTVSLNGKPLSSGTVTMEGGPSKIALMAPIGEDGSYEMRTHEADGLAPGSYKVAVSSQRIAEGDLVVLATDVQKARPAGTTIPKKYHSVETSGLTADVKPGDNPPFNFDLK